MLKKLQYVALTILWKESFGVLGQRFNINKNDRENTWQTVEKKAIDKVCMEHDTRVKFNKHTSEILSWQNRWEKNISFSFFF